MTTTLCATCGIETDPALTDRDCAICADERQYVAEGGQRWTTLDDLRADGRRVEIAEIEPDLYGMSVEPSVGIGQTSYLVRTPQGLVMWDVLPFVDEAAATAVLDLGPVLAIATSHPHLFGVQTAWSDALGGVPVYVNGDDAHWLRLETPAIRRWTGRQSSPTA